jgi:ribosome-binding factor A
VNTEPKRAVRVAELIHKQLAQSLRRDLSDPRLHDVFVTRVELTDDLQIAKVFVRLQTGDSPESRARALQGLRSAGKLLRKGVRDAVDLRRLPELRFAIDEGQDAQAKIDALQAEIERDRQT